MSFECVVCEPQNKHKSQIIDILERQDEESREDERTSDMSRNLFVAEDKSVTDREALEIYYHELTEYCTVALSEDDDGVIGFSVCKKNDEFFADGALEYYPHLAVTHSAVDENHRRKGVWTELRRTIEKKVVPECDIQYIVSAVSEENDASQKANESIGMYRVATLGYDDSETTHVYAKHRSLID